MAMAVVYSNFNGRLVHENRGGTERGYVPDPLGSTVALVNSAGNITDEWRYWPYGEVARHEGKSTTPFTFVGTLGYFKDLISKLTYVRARYYQAFIGQWMTKDPIWEAELAYQYARSNPTGNSDRTGLMPIAVAAGVACLIAAGVSGIITLVTSGGSWSDALCSAGGACLKAAILTLLYGSGLGFIAGCLIAAVLAALVNVVVDICKCTFSKDKCKNCGLTVCDFASIIATGVLGCTISGATADTGKEVIGSVLGLLYGLVDAAWGYACVQTGTSGGLTFDIPRA